MSAKRAGWVLGPLFVFFVLTSSDTDAQEEINQQPDLQNPLANAFIMGTVATETISGRLANTEAQFKELRTSALGFNLGRLRFQETDIRLASLGFGGMNNRRGAAGRLARADRRQSGDLSGKGTTVGQGKLGGFINGSVEFGGKDKTARRGNGFEFDATNITLGIDYQMTEKGVVGITGGYDHLNSDLDKTQSGAGGGVEADGYTFSGFGSYYLGSFFNYASVSYSRKDYDLRRDTVVNRTARANSESDEFTTTLGSTVELSQGAWTYGPYLRLNYLNLDIDGWTEQGAGRNLNLQVDDQEVESLTTVLGGRVSYALSHRFGVLVPQLRAGWIHQFLNNTREITARDPTNNLLVAKSDAPDRNYALLGAGASLVFRGGTQGFVNYRTLLGLRHIEDHTVTLGVRHQF